MPTDISAGADTKIIISPRVMALILASIIGGYLWLFANFVTKAEAGQYTQALTEHITEATLYRLEADLRDADDKAWALEQQMTEPGKDTPSSREKLREYQKRVQKISEALRCIRAGNQNCTTGQ